MLVRVEIGKTATGLGPEHFDKRFKKIETSLKLNAKFVYLQVGVHGVQLPLTTLIRFSLGQDPD